MENRTPINITNELNEKLETLANEFHTDTETAIKILIAKKEAIDELEGYLTETKVSKSGSKNYTYSTVLPKPIVNKFKLDKGRKLYWDIKDHKIIITPVPLNEED